MNELNYLIHEGYKYDPDMVIVAFFTGNDFIDAIDPGFFTAYRGIRMERPIMDKMNAFIETKIFLRKNCYMYGVAVEFLKGPKTKERNKYKEDLWLLEYCLLNKSCPPLEPSISSFAEFQKWCKDNNKEFIVLILPHRIQLEPERAKHICRKYGIDFDEVDLDRLSRILSGALSEKSIGVLDITKDLRDFADKEGEVSFINDSHYNEKTHEYIGNILKEKLLKE
ncbi:hypothetical protein JW926_06320 [Candidatus Sumerlaeota bacterium]|nr:hypothetical protein [Candidatus Sumerlaeota bacterium]